MRPTLLVFLTLFASALVAQAQSAAALDVEQSRKSLSIRPRNPVKSAAPVVKRSYERNAAKGIEVEVLERQDGTREERPLVTLPILFEVNSDQLLDDVSRSNVRQMAALLKDLAAEPRTSFHIQGHTSAEGDAAKNQQLSERRAARIQVLLTAQGVPAAALTPVGLGEDAARFSDSSPELLLQQDRRVLIVRMR